MSLLIFRLTASRLAAIGSWLVLLVTPQLFAVSLGGYRPKYFALALGLYAIYTSIFGKRYFVAGLLAGAVLGFWQMGITYLIIIAIIALIAGQLLRAVAGMSVALAVIALILLVTGALPHAIEQVLLSPVIVSTDASLGLGWTTLRLLGQSRNIDGISGPLRHVITGIGIAVTLAGISGALQYGLGKFRENSWLAVGTLLFLLQVLLLDFDSSPDTIHLRAFLGIGFGLLLKKLPDSRGGVIVIAVIAALSIAQVPTAIKSISCFSSPEAMTICTRISANDRRYLHILEDFEAGEAASSCYYLNSPQEQQFVSLTGRDPNATHCPVDLRQTWKFVISR